MEHITPHTDSRHKQLDRALSRHQGRPEALIELLHTAQDVFGYLPRDVLAYIADALFLPRSRVFGVASFYPLFSLEKPRAHEMTICMGTACYVNGAAALLHTARAGCQCGADGMTDSLRLRSAHCLGACGRGPLLQVDHRTIVDAEPADVSNAIRELQEAEA